MAVIDTARAKALASKYAIVLVLVALVLGISVFESSFLRTGNLINILQISSVRIIIALGVGGILITRGTDLSAGRTVGLCACIAASLMQRPDYSSKMFPDLPYLPLIVPIAAAIAAGFCVGLFNGLVVAYLKVPPFITTLGTMVMVYGTSSLYVDRPPRGAMPIGGLREDFTSLGTGDWSGTPKVIVIAAVVLFLYWVILNWTRFGKNIYAIGGNPEAARVAGVPVHRNLIAVYVLGGVMYGLAGVLLSARSGGATNNYGNMYELDAIAAAVIGGVSTAGGVGTISGMLTGVLIFQVLDNGLVVLGVSPYWQQIIKGAIIIAAVAIDIRKYVTKR
jgi:methyl-galactoside transport system permease protein